MYTLLKDKTGQRYTVLMDDRDIDLLVTMYHMTIVVRGTFPCIALLYNLFKN